MCNCSRCGLSIANFLFAAQKIASCCAVTAIVATLILTLILMLGVGVGLGYHYCVVESKTIKLGKIKKRYRNYFSYGTNIEIAKKISAVSYIWVLFAIITAGTGIITCLILTLIMMLMLGIGLGYNYCFVDYETMSRYRYAPDSKHNNTTEPDNYENQPNIPENTSLQSSVLMKKIRQTEVNNADSDAKDIYFNEAAKPVSHPAEYIDTPSTKHVYRKQKQKNNMFYDEIPDSSILKDYKFWAVAPHLSPETINTAVDVSHTNELQSNELDIVTQKSSTFEEAKTLETNDTLKIVAANENETEKTLETTTQSMVLSLNGLDLMALLSQLRAENRNYSLQIITS